MTETGKIEYAKITFTAPLDFLDTFDEAIKEAGMTRSEAIRRGMRQVLYEIKKRGR